MAYLAHNQIMTAEYAELPVNQARDHFSQAVNRALFADEVTIVTRGRNHERAAAIVPAWYVDAIEEMLDARDGQIAAERLADLRAGRTESRPAEDVFRELGL